MRVHLPFLIVSLLFASSLLAAAEENRGSVEASVRIIDEDGIERTCAGIQTYVFEVASKSTKNVEEVYGSAGVGYAGIYETPKIIGIHQHDLENDRWYGKTPLNRRNMKNMHRDTCDEDGFTKFSNLKPGDYYLLVPVFWLDNSLQRRARVYDEGFAAHEISGNYVGGSFIVKTSVVSGEVTEIGIKTAMPG